MDLLCTYFSHPSVKCSYITLKEVCTVFVMNTTNHTINDRNWTACPSTTLICILLEGKCLTTATLLEFWKFVSLSLNWRSYGKKTLNHLLRLMETAPFILPSVWGKSNPSTLSKIYIFHKSLKIWQRNKRAFSIEVMHTADGSFSSDCLWLFQSVLG